MLHSYLLPFLLSGADLTKDRQWRKDNGVGVNPTASTTSQGFPTSKLFSICMVVDLFYGPQRKTFKKSMGLLDTLFNDMLCLNAQNYNSKVLIVN